MNALVFLKLVSEARFADTLSDAPADRLSGGSLVMDPASRTALETALELPDCHVTVLSMGPAGAETILRQALCLGAETAYLLSDPGLRGADTLTTASALAGAAKCLPAQDWYFTGQRALDSETGHIGPQLAALLGLPFVGGAITLSGTEITAVTGICRVTLPAVCAVACAPERRLPTLRGIRAAREKEILPLTLRDIGEVPASPTRVVASRRVQWKKRAGTPVSPAEAAEMILLAGKRPAPETRFRPVFREGLPAGELWAVMTGLTPADFSLAAFAGEALYLPRVSGADTLFPAAQVVCCAIRKTHPRAVLFSADSAGRVLAPMVGTMLGTGVTADCTALCLTPMGLEQTRPTYGGQLLAAVCTATAPAIASVRPGILPPAEGDIPVYPMETGTDTRISCLSSAGETAVSLTQAGLILSGGGGMGSRAGWETLAQMAHRCGGAVGASRAAVAAGYAPRACQIGQTGTAVRPALYAAFGISGTVQHLCAVQGAETILAVNTDDTAPIAGCCDCFCHCSWEKVLKELEKMI